MGCSGSHDDSGTLKSTRCAKLITAEQLQAKLGKVQVLDCTSGPSAFDNYKKKHIYSAIFLNLDMFRDTTQTLPHMMPTEAQVRAHLTDIGVGMTKPIVCYDQANGMWATRASLVFLNWGFKDVSVLDGGQKAWGERDWQAREARGIDSNLKGLKNKELSVDFAYIQSITSGKNQAQLVDARPAQMHESGCIPGSISCPMPNLLDQDGKLKPTADLKAALTAAGVSTSGPVIFYCQGGVMCTVLHMVSIETGHNSNCKIYDGSYSEYSVKAK